MRKYLVLVLGIFSFLFACEKDESPKEELKIDYVVKAGLYDLDYMTHVDFNPNIVVVNPSVGCGSAESAYSIFLDGDSIEDLKIVNHIYNDMQCECLVGDCFPVVYSYVQIDVVNQEYQVCIDSNNWVLPMVVGDTIEMFNNWQNDDNLLLGYRDLITSHTVFGNWQMYECDTNVFLAVRKLIENDTLYGWLRLDTYKSDVTIFEHGFEKE